MAIPWGPTGQLVYERTYSRTKPDGTKETWPETVERVVDGNLALAGKHLPGERERLIELMTQFKILPAGRHLWASGVKGRQYLFNCHVAGWGEKPSDHFAFTFLRLMEGGGVGSNYSNRFLHAYPRVEHKYQVHIVCDPGHPDFQQLKDAGVLSDTYTPDWDGAFAVEDSREGWAAALVDLIDTYYRWAEHTNRVYDVSRVRAAGARLQTFGGRASGPLPLAKMLLEISGILNDLPYYQYVDEERGIYSNGHMIDGISAMRIDHAIAQCVVAGGNRRSARMAIMHWADPQIMDFLHCKEGTGDHWTTNISVEVDDEFWRLVKSEHNEGAAATAKLVLEEIAQGMLRNGEPGFWNSDLSNVGEPNQVIATNPCGEIALEPWENCNLGHVNLSAFVGDSGLIYPAELAEAHRLITRFLIRATYGDVNDPAQAEVLARNRRIGVGHFGFASMVAKMGIKYSDAPKYVKGLLQWMADEVTDAAQAYAHELRIPVPVKLRTVAPTGTIAKMPGVSEGIHPIFAKYFIRRIRFSTIDPDQRETALEYAAKGYKVEKDQYADNTVVVEIPTKDTLLAEVEAIHGEEAEDIVQSAADLTLEEMLRVQALYQEYWADNAVSFTANVNPDKYTVDDVVNVLREIGPSLKGATVFPEQSMPQAPYERLSKEAYETATAKQIADGVDEECANGACPVR